MKVVQIAELLGVSHQTVRNIAKRLGLEPQKEGKAYEYTSEQVKQIAAAAGRDMPNLEEDAPEEQPRWQESSNQLEQMRELRSQIRIKDNQISRLLEQIAAKDSQISRLLDNNNELTKNLSLLNAANNKELVSGEVKKPWYKRLFE